MVLWRSPQKALPVWLITQRIPTAADWQAELEQPSDRRRKSHLRTRPSPDEVLALFIERGTMLRNGDPRPSQDRRIVKVVAKAEAVLHITPPPHGSSAGSKREHAIHCVLWSANLRLSCITALRPRHHCRRLVLRVSHQHSHMTIACVTSNDKGY